MTDYTSQPSTLSLLRGVAEGALGLFRKEVELAKAEAAESVDRMLGAAEIIVIATVMLIGAFVVLLGALVGVLQMLLIAWGMHEHVANTVSAGVIGIVLAVVAWIMLSGALRNLRLRALTMPKTRDALGRDAQLVKEKM